MSLIYQGMTIAGTPSARLEFQRAGYINAWVAGTTISTSTFDLNGITGLPGYDVDFTITDAASLYTDDVFTREPYINIPGFTSDTIWYQFTTVTAVSGVVEVGEVLWSQQHDLDATVDNAFIFSIG